MIYTFRKVPAKFVREWKELILEGKPLYINNDEGGADKNDNENLLDEQDFKEYQVNITRFYSLSSLF